MSKKTSTGISKIDLPANLKPKRVKGLPSLDFVRKASPEKAVFTNKLLQSVANELRDKALQEVSVKENRYRQYDKVDEKLKNDILNQVYKNLKSDGVADEALED